MRGIVKNMARPMVRPLVGQGAINGREVPRWWESNAVGQLDIGIDIRGMEGGSVVTLDANGGVYEATDLSGNRNDFVHWRASGNGEIAQRAGTEGDYYAVTTTNATGERHIGCKISTCTGVTGRTDWHGFMLMRASSPKAHATSVNLSPGYYAFGGQSAGPRPSLGLTSTGGLGSGGLTAFASTSNATKAVNIESLAGRAETSAAEKYALVELRCDSVTGTIESWVNGYQTTYLAQIPTVAMDYFIMGKQDLNNGQSSGFDIPMWAYAQTANLSLEQAAVIRAAILADYGIDEWDGATYPTP